MPQPQTAALRAVKARVYTESLRIHGELHLHPKGDAAKLLNGSRPYLSLSNCQVYRQGSAHPPQARDLRAEPEFLVIPKESVLWLASEDAPPPQTQQGRNLYVLYPESDYVLKGEFPAPQGVRLSDFLTRSFGEKSFHVLHRAELRLASSNDLVRAGAMERFSHLTLNMKKVAGVFDLAERGDKLTFSGFS